MNRKVESFIEHVKTETKEAGVKFLLPKVKYIMPYDGSRCHGYFDEENMTLKVAANRHLAVWLPVLVHEYSHFCQSQEKCAVWVNSTDKYGDSSEVMFKWITGKEYNPRTIKKYVKWTMDVELDCEKRAVKNIRRFDLPIDTKAYTQRANSYVYFHNYVLLNRKWYKEDKAPYEIKAIVSRMPSRFLSKYCPCPQKYLDLFDKYC